MVSLSWGGAVEWVTDSIALAPGKAGADRIYFAPWDTSAQAPIAPGGVYSGELEPSSSGKLTGAFSWRNSIGAVQAEGHLELSAFPEEALSRNNAVDSVLSGYAYTANNSNVWILTAHFEREAGEAVGTYSITSNPHVGALPMPTMTGSWRLPGFSGQMAADSANAQVSFVLEWVDNALETLSVTGVADFLLIDPDTFTLSNALFSTGALEWVADGVWSFARSGSAYIADASFADGDPGTGFADFTGGTWSVSGLTDSDGNGIPDLTDPVAPLAISVAPGDQVVESGMPLVLAVEATGDALRYEWWHGDELVSTASTFSIEAATRAQSGAYRVIVSDGYGSSAYREAIVEVVPPQTRLGVETVGAETLRLSWTASNVHTYTLWQTLDMEEWAVAAELSDREGHFLIELPAHDSEGRSLFYRLEVDYP